MSAPLLLVTELRVGPALAPAPGAVLDFTDPAWRCTNAG